jgi:hypothetical protein
MRDTTAIELAIRITSRLICHGQQGKSREM